MLERINFKDYLAIAKLIKHTVMILVLFYFLKGNNNGLSSVSGSKFTKFNKKNDFYSVEVVRVLDNMTNDEIRYQSSCFSIINNFADSMRKRDSFGGLNCFRRSEKHFFFL